MVMLTSFSWAPIEQMLTARARSEDCLEGSDDIIPNHEYLGISRCVYQRAKTTGLVTRKMAERIAFELGMHVANIWPEYYKEFPRKRSYRPGSHHARVLPPEPKLEPVCANCGCRVQAHRVEGYGKVKCSCGHCDGWRDG